MANTNVNANWEKIQNGVNETERLIGLKSYNLAMIKARQTLEFMVKLQADRACIVDGGDLMALIDSLYQNRWISKTTCEHYHKIRMIGNQAAHEGDNSAYNANQAYHALSQEVYTFANDYQNARKGARRPASSAAPQQQSTRSRKKQPKRQSITMYDLLKLLIPVLCIILLICVIKLVRPSKGSETETTSASAVTTEAVTETSSAEPESESSTVVYKTTDVLNVRPQPSTDAERIGQLEAGVTVEYVRSENDQWAVIMYNGSEAYVSKEFLTTE